MTKPPGWGQAAPRQFKAEQISTKARTSLEMSRFDDLLKQQGVRVRVYRTMFCPNVKSIDGAEHDIQCQVCKGSGFLDVRPIDTMAFLQDQKMSKPHEAEGLIDQSTTMGTFPSDVALQYFTLVHVLDFTDVYFERIKRQAGTTDVLKYEAKTINVLVDQFGKEYFSEIDFTLGPNRDIQWKVGRSPTPGTIYSINYQMDLLYRCIEAVHVNRFGQDLTDRGTVKMKKGPEQWRLAKVYLVDRRDSNGNPIPPNLIHDPDPA